MAHVARIEKTGGPDVIVYGEASVGEPGEGEVRIRSTAIGLNYIDTYHRSGLYPVDLPAVLGVEGVGVVEAVGQGVSDVAEGDRVGTFGPTLGAYASKRILNAGELVRLPDSVTDEQAAALLLKGCTAECLVERCAKVEAGQTVLVYAAAGGVGHILVGWLKAIGATVIAVVGSADKAEAAKDNGADHAIRHDLSDIAGRVDEITDGAGVPVIFDGVGKPTWQASLKSAARRGLIVSYGNAGGPVNGVDLGVLARSGSLFVTRPTLFDYAATPEEKQHSVDRLFAMVDDGAVTVEIGQTFALADVAAAHSAIEASDTMGATILRP